MGLASLSSTARRACGLAMCRVGIAALMLSLVVSLVNVWSG